MMPSTCCSTTFKAAKRGHLECLKYLRKNEGSVWSIWVFRKAIKYGQLECVKYIHEDGYFLGVNGPANIAAQYGQLDCLKYLHQNRYPCDSETMEWATMYGHLNCLIYLHKNGCPCTSHTIYCAVYNDNLNCLIYLLDNGCEYDDTIWFTRSIRILLYLYSKRKINAPIPTETHKLIQMYILRRNTLIDSAKHERHYIFTDIWNIILDMIY